MKILNTGLMHRCFIREKNNMKYILFLFTLLLLACSSLEDWWDNCPKDKEFIRVIAYVEIDTIISVEKFNRFKDGVSKTDSYQTEFKDFGSNQVPLTLVAMGDTLCYLLDIKNQNNILIVVDSSNTPCETNSDLSKNGYDQYRVDAKRVHSCVFYYEQMCY